VSTRDSAGVDAEIRAALRRVGVEGDVSTRRVNGIASSTQIWISVDGQPDVCVLYADGVPNLMVLYSDYTFEAVPRGVLADFVVELVSARARIRITRWRRRAFLTVSLSRSSWTADRVYRGNLEGWEIALLGAEPGGFEES
jgi:hypothetical protein